MAALIADHLWQSTVVAGVIGLLTLAFRSHGAHVRHGLWLAASIKFLVPFALLVALGGALGLRAAAPVVHLARQVLIVVDEDAPVGPLLALNFAPPSSLVPPTTPIWSESKAWRRRWSGRKGRRSGRFRCCRSYSSRWRGFYASD